MTFKRALVICGFHGTRHHISHILINVKSYRAKQAKREQDVLNFMHNNGLGA